MYCNHKFNYIALHSVPRSGSSWLGQIINSCPNVIYKFQPLFSYKFKDFLNETSTSSRINSFFRKISETKDDFLDQTGQIEGGFYPEFEKDRINTIVYKEVRYHHILKNMLDQFRDIKIVGLVRNPLSVINSWLKAPREFRRDLGWSEIEEWREAPKKNLSRKEEFFGYQKWKETASLFLDLERAYPNNFYLIKYIDLVQNTEKFVKQLFDFLSLEYSGQTDVFLHKSMIKDLDNEYAVYKVKRIDSSWKDELNSEIIQLIVKDIEGTLFQKFMDTGV
ncbi:MAG: sulfotransferase domain-containing protein [Candidatus Peribacteraceae bacterium]|nr:sulfotransferase domain-containing protein [Candidatus Peribacteraceae bacterium]